MIEKQRIKPYLDVKAALGCEETLPAKLIEYFLPIFTSFTAKDEHWVFFFSFCRPRWT
jgi:hypothetical protein